MYSIYNYTVFASVCVCFLAGVQAIYNIPANLILLSSSFWDISRFSYLLRRKHQVRVIAIVAVGRLTLLLNPWEDTALHRALGPPYKLL